MKNKNFAKKLSLNKETITALNYMEMNGIAGGFVALTPLCSNPCVEPSEVQTKSCPSICLHTCSC